VRVCELTSTDSGKGILAGSYERGNVEFLEQLSGCQLLKDVSGLKSLLSGLQALQNSSSPSAS